VVRSRHASVEVEHAMRRCLLGLLAAILASMIAPGPLHASTGDLGSLFDQYGARAQGWVLLPGSNVPTEPPPGYVDTDPAFAGEDLAGAPWMGRIEDLPQIVANEVVDEVAIATGEQRRCQQRRPVRTSGPESDRVHARGTVRLTGPAPTPQT